MINRIAATALTLTVLGAGAFALAASEPTKHETAHLRKSNFEKNQTWPLKGNITMNPCANFSCQEFEQSNFPCWQHVWEQTATLFSTACEGALMISSSVTDA